MAKTYAGYVKREVANEIDWSSIGSGISDMLLDERKAREDKKKEIDDASREFSKVLTEAEGSGHTGLNQFFLDGANSIQEVRLMQDKLLRSGELRLKDYNIQRQNAVDGTNEMLALVKGYDAKYKEKMDRLQQGLSAAQEQYQMEQLEGFSNFQNHQLYVNPTNGQFSIGKTVPGKGGINELSKNPNDFSTMQGLKNRLNIKIDKYDWNANVQQGVDNLAKIVLAKNVGGVKTEEDARQMGDSYKKAKADWIKSMMTDSTNVGSMLTDWIGGYGFTQDKSERDADDSKILLVPDPRQKSSGNLVPDLTDTQETAVKERLDREFESRIDKVQTAMPTPRPVTQSTKNYGKKVKNLSNFGKTVVEAITSTDPEASSSALGIMKDYGIDFRRTKKTKDGLQFEIFNTNTKEYEEESVSFKKDDLYGTVEKIFQKTLGNDSEVDIDDIMEAMGGREFFKDKDISDIEALFSPKEIVEVLEIDDPTNLVLDPINPFNSSTGKQNFVTIDNLIEKVEQGNYEDEDLQKYIKGILKAQGLDDDISVEVDEAGRTISPAGRFFGAKADERFATITKNGKEIEKIDLNDVENTFRDIIKRITKQSQREGTFYEGDDSVPETQNNTAPKKQYANLKEFIVDFPGATLTQLKEYNESQNQ
jgi:hypothetical protein